MDGWRLDASRVPRGGLGGEGGDVGYLNLGCVGLIPNSAALCRYLGTWQKSWSNVRSYTTGSGSVVRFLMWPGIVWFMETTMLGTATAYNPGS